MKRFSEYLDKATEDLLSRYNQSLERGVLDEVKRLVEAGELKVETVGPLLSHQKYPDQRIVTFEGGVRLSVAFDYRNEAVEKILEENKYLKDRLEIEKKLCSQHSRLIGEQNRKLDLLERGIEALHLDSIGLHKTT
jgi:hypothetical protein